MQSLFSQAGLEVINGKIAILFLILCTIDWVLFTKRIKKPYSLRLILLRTLVFGELFSRQFHVISSDRFLLGSLFTLSFLIVCLVITYFQLSHKKIVTLTCDINSVEYIPNKE